MKAFINGDKFVGTPQEIADFISRSAHLKRKPLNQTTPNITTDLSPKGAYFQKGEQEALRRKLAEDPNYNPFGGVVPSKETMIEREENRQYAAELDTGIEYE